MLSLVILQVKLFMNKDVTLLVLNYKKNIDLVLQCKMGNLLPFPNELFGFLEVF